VGRATWEALTGEPARSGTFENVPSVEHILLGQRADIVLVAPATADFLASMASGEARDLLGNALLATTAPVVVAPAMHSEMWRHPATKANVATLAARGVHVIEPDDGRLTGADSGPGRLPEPEDLVAALYAIARSADMDTSATTAADHGWGDLGGVRIVISAGGTREPIDAVRFLGNRSSGRQGFALADAARERGADVTVVAANVALPLGEGITRVDVETSAQLADAVRSAAAEAHVVVMAAAVADYRPASSSATKMKKDGNPLRLELVETEDILASLVKSRAPGQIVVGFAAETGDDAGTVIDHGRAKALRKGADLLVVNAVGETVGFGDVANAVTILDAKGEEVAVGEGTKLVVAHRVLDQVAARLKR
jgi:phosphopantothenoylcysteine decarboxylase/phosphopantothenate--cysteine ligase